jgi:hypothetical protein
VPFHALSFRLGVKILEPVCVTTDMSSSKAVPSTACHWSNCDDTSMSALLFLSASNWRTHIICIYHCFLYILFFCYSYFIHYHVEWNGIKRFPS